MTAAPPPYISAMPPPLQVVAQRVPQLSAIIYFVWRLVERWGTDRCALIAAAMAFFGLLSVFPIVLAVVAILGQTLVGNEEVLEKFRAYIADFFPGAAGDILSEVNKIASNTDAGTLSIVGIASLLWSGRAFFDTLAAVLNGIWPNTEPRGFLQHQLALWSTFLGAGVLWLLSTGTTFALSALRALSQEFPKLFINYQSVLWEILPRFTSWLLTVVMFWLIYWFLPNRQQKVRRRIVLGAAVIAALGWEAAKFAFTGFIGGVAAATRYQAIYGSVATVVLALMWIYISSMILLLGAEAAAAFEETCAAMTDQVPETGSSGPQFEDQSSKPAPPYIPPDSSPAKNGTGSGTGKGIAVESGATTASEERDL